MPLVFAAHSDVFCAPGEKGRFQAVNELVYGLYEKFRKEGWKDIYYLPADEMYSGGTEGTVDTIHPNDLGMTTMAEVFGKGLKLFLRLP